MSGTQPDGPSDQPMSYTQKYGADYGEPAGGHYGQGGGAMALGPRTTDRGATPALVLGIVSLVCCGPFTGIPAIIVGGNSRRRIDDSRGRLDGHGMATAGYLLGWASIALFVVGLVLGIVLGVRGAHSTPRPTVDCRDIANASRCT